jgi:hypothetical protein
MAEQHAGLRRVARRPAGRIAMVALWLATAGCGLALEPASIERVREAESRWNAAPILDYGITVDIDRPGERRRNEITVRDGRIVSASVSYWDPGEDRWSRPAPLREEQALPFTPTGLLEMVRREIGMKSRLDLRIALKGAPPFPHRILMGGLRRGEGIVPNSEAVITVRRFEPRR